MVSAVRSFTTPARSPLPSFFHAGVDVAPRRGSLVLHSIALCSGDVLRDATLAWQDWGAHGDPVVIVLGGISAGRDLAGWWSAQCSPGKALDPRHHRLVSIDWLGGADASTGPADAGAFPAIDSKDQAHALLALLNHLGIAQVAAIVGASYGACVGQHLAALLGSRAECLVSIGAGHRASPWALALRTLQRAGIVAADGPTARRAALERARQIAVLGYRTPQELERRFGDVDGQDGVLGWLGAHGRRFAERFSAEAFLCLSASLDAHHCAPSSIRIPTVVVAFEGDLIAPPELLERFAGCIAATAQCVRLASEFGHDAFLKDARAVASVLRCTLAKGVDA